jgi:hypothetical protein
MKSFISRSISPELLVTPSTSRPRSISFAGAGADHVARRLQRQRGDTLAVEHVVEGGDQIGRGIDQRAIEVEYDNAGRAHRHSLAGARDSCKGPGLGPYTAVPARKTTLDMRPPIADSREHRQHVDMDALKRQAAARRWSMCRTA